MIVEKRITIKNKSGLHARPASLFVQIANKYDCDIMVRKGRQKVNGKSIMGILMLAAEKGSKIAIIAEGNGSKEAVGELQRLLLSETIEDFDAKKKK